MQVAAPDSSRFEQLSGMGASAVMTSVAASSSREDIGEEPFQHSRIQRRVVEPSVAEELGPRNSMRLFNVSTVKRRRTTRLYCLRTVSRNISFSLTAEPHRTT